MPKIVKDLKTDSNGGVNAPNAGNSVPPNPSIVQSSIPISVSSAQKESAQIKPTAIVPPVNTGSNSSEPAPTFDTQKKFRLIKSTEDLKLLTGGTSSFPLPTIDRSQITKKPINIPICDTTIDDDYNESLEASYNLPISYVKYIKNISDETDITVDYHADLEDENWLKIINTKLSLTDFTLTKLEQLINILEKANGNSRDTIIQSIALKALLDKSGCDQSFIYKLLPDLYRYWVSRRDKIGKSLVRKYWPPVLATDTNPHQVFRVRDKERYRLRRHRRNDLDSFRKMQQLRKEFVQAKTILQLILERELLSEANFRIERDIFQKRVRQISNTIEDTNYKGIIAVDNSSSNDVLLHEPLFKPLWFQSLNKSTSYDNLALESKTYDYDETGSASENGNQTLTTKKSLLLSGNLKNEKSLDDSFEGKGNNKKYTNVGRKRKQKDKLVLYTLNKNGEVEIVKIDDPTQGNSQSRRQNYTSLHHDADVTIPYSGYTVPSILEVTSSASNGSIDTSAISGIAGNGTDAGNGENTPTVVSTASRDIRVIHEDVEGPKYVCNPQWPNFTQTLSIRDQTPHQSSAAEYLRELEMKTDEFGEKHAPIKYRSRYRIGRGGRLIIDRVPIYSDGVEGEELNVNIPTSNEQKTITYQYPFLLQAGTTTNTGNAHNTNPSAPNNINQFTNLPNKTQRANSLPLTVNAIAQLNNEHLQKSTTIAPFSTNGNAGNPTIESSSFQHPAHPASSLIPKPLTEIPPSNRRLLTTYKKNNPPKNLVSSYQWSNTLPNLFPTLPPMIPPPQPLLSQEKRRRLQEILGQSDSEDEKIIIPRSNSGIDVERNMTNKAVATEQAMTKFVFHV